MIFPFSECFYADDTKLEGDGNSLTEKPVMVKKTADCIDTCINTFGCRYWTVSKSLNLTVPVECHLKSWKGRRIPTPGFISGSLPSACCEFLNISRRIIVSEWVALETQSDPSSITNLAIKWTKLATLDLYHSANASYLINIALILIN